MQKLVVLLLLLVLAPLPSGAAAEIESQRQRFLSAQQRILRGEAVDVQAETAALRGYVLAPYLEYFSLQRNLAASSPEHVAAFLAAHADLPVTEQLRFAYLRQLAKQRRWREFERFYQPVADAELRCHHLQARLARGAIDQTWLDEALALWLVGRSQPAACDPVFEQLYRRDVISADQIWERVTLLLENGHDSLAAHFRKRLDPARQEWLERWLAAHRQPRDVLERPGFALDHPFAGKALAHALRRLASNDAAAAMDHLERYREQLPFGTVQLGRLQRHVALQAAYSQDPRTLAWLDALPPGLVDDHVRVWMARMALRNQNWPRLLRAIAALPPAERRRSQWRYWRAHALEAVGEPGAAQTEFTLLALERHYYGFLAADRVSLPYSLNHAATTLAADVMAQVKTMPGIVRAGELYRLGLLPEARREWQAALRRMDQAQQAQAAILALRWGWYERAVATANQAGLSDDLELRFPTPYRDQIERYSRMHSLEPHITYAVVRKESAFQPDARSRVGALGLMQVMPQTGRQVARRLQVELPSRGSLLDVDTNLKLGSAYLRAMLDRYGGSLVLAAAAYNAGPQRVADWLQRNADLPPALWIEAISYYETREYVKSILAFAAVFDWRLNGKPQRISDYLRSFDPQTLCLVESGNAC